AHAALAYVYYRYDWNWPAAEQEFQRALELNPNDATAHHWYGVYLAAVRERHEEAIAEERRALELDPLSVIINAGLAQLYNFPRRPDEAIVQAHKALELDPNFWLAHLGLVEAYLQKGMYAEALAACQKTGTPRRELLTGY